MHRFVPTCTAWLLAGLIWFSWAAPAQAGPVLRYAGATTLQRDFMPEAAREFEKTTGIAMTISGGNTDPGLRALRQGEIDLAGSGRFLTAEEKAAGLVEHLLGWDALGVVVHITNPVENLSMEQLRDLLTGQLSNWREVGGRDLPVLQVSTPRGSGMHVAVEQLLLAGRHVSPRAIVCMMIADTDQQVAQLPAGIAVLSTSMVDAENVKLVKVGGVPASVENVTARRYPLIKPLLLVTKGVPSGALAAFLEFANGAKGQAILAKKFFPQAR